MTDTKRLRDAIDSKGYKYQFVASELGISRYGLQKKIENDTEFKASEIKRLSTLLGLTLHEQSKIFFA